MFRNSRYTSTALTTGLDKNKNENRENVYTYMCNEVLTAIARPPMDNIKHVDVTIKIKFCTAHQDGSRKNDAVSQKTNSTARPCETPRYT